MRFLNKYLVKANDDNKTFYDFVKDSNRIESNEINTLNINVFSNSLTAVVNPEFMNSSTVFKFDGIIHSKVFLHLDWTISQFTKIVSDDILRSLISRLDLLTEESKNSE